METDDGEFGYTQTSKLKLKINNKKNRKNG